ncbi:MAG: LpxI family protein, partial [Mangrovicoccus sp.]
RGKAILDALAGQDVAQACVIAGGQCLGIESVYGTDALLKFVTDQRPNRRPETGGVLVKRPKTGQELRVDMPVIGISTIEAALAAKLSGVCLAAGQVMVLDCPAVASLCDREGISLWAI